MTCSRAGQKALDLAAHDGAAVQRMRWIGQARVCVCKVTEPYSKQVVQDTCPDKGLVFCVRRTLQICSVVMPRQEPCTEASVLHSIHPLEATCRKIVVTGMQDMLKRWIMRCKPCRAMSAMKH